MSGFKLRLFILTLGALIGCSILTFFSIETSWSENAWKALNWLLNFTLITIASSFLELAHKHPKKNLEVYKWFNKKIRLEHLCFYTSWAFFFIIIFDLNSPVIPKNFHNTATGLAVLGLYLVMAGWYRMWSKDWWINMILINGSTLSLAIGFIFKDSIPIKYSEYAIMLSGLFFIYKTLKDR